MSMDHLMSRAGCASGTGSAMGYRILRSAVVALMLCVSATAYGNGPAAKGSADLTYEFCLSAGQIDPPLGGDLPASRGTAT